MADNKQDFTRDTLDQLQRTLGKLQVSMSKRIPYGPRVSIMSNKDKRLEIQNQGAQQTMAQIQSMGVAEWDAYMKELYK